MQIQRDVSERLGHALGTYNIKVGSRWVHLHMLACLTALEPVRIILTSLALLNNLLLRAAHQKALLRVFRLKLAFVVELDLLPFDGCICLDSILTYLKQWRECWVAHRIADKGQGKKSDDGRVLLGQVWLQNINSYIYPIESVGTIFGVTCSQCGWN